EEPALTGRHQPDGALAPGRCDRPGAARRTLRPFQQCMSGPGRRDHPAWQYAVTAIGPFLCRMGTG
nr:hypothetical protein [Tanacetum cinerariifolium]